MEVHTGGNSAPRVYIVCEREMLILKKYKDFMYNDTNHIKETNMILKTSVTKCMLNRSVRFRKGEMSVLMKYKYFLLDHKNDIKKQMGFLRKLLSV